MTSNKPEENNSLIQIQIYISLLPQYRRIANYWKSQILKRITNDSDCLNAHQSCIFYLYTWENQISCSPLQLGVKWKQCHHYRPDLEYPCPTGPLSFLLYSTQEFQVLETVSSPFGPTLLGRAIQKNLLTCISP